MQIFEQMVNATFDDLQGHNLFIELAPQARQTLHSLCLQDLSNGGRGIRNQLEARLLNPPVAGTVRSGRATGRALHDHRVGHHRTEDGTSLNMDLSLSRVHFSGHYPRPGATYWHLVPGLQHPLSRLHLCRHLGPRAPTLVARATA
nr:hypothetical protein GCM10020185_88010 [Pseudomonas brassicacearum subsp. brassicacearum]